MALARAAALFALAAVPVASLAATPCGFERPAVPGPLVLGPLNPSRPVGIGVTRSIGLVGDCRLLMPGSVEIAGGNAQVLRGPGAAVLPYRALAALGSSGQGARWITLNVQVMGSDYANLPAGHYGGALTLLLLP